MKFDELKRHHINEVMDMHNLTRGEMGYSVVYYANDVDAAIAELKKENLNLKAKNIELQSFYDLHANVDNYIDKLKAENELLKEHIANGDVSRITWIDEVIELKQKLHDAEMRADIAEAANTEYRIDLKNIKYNIAKHARNQYNKHNRQTLMALWLARALRAKEHYRRYHGRFLPDLKLTDIPEYNKWVKVEQLCRAKAEEFK